MHGGSMLRQTASAHACARPPARPRPSPPGPFSLRLGATQRAVTLPIAKTCACVDIVARAAAAPLWQPIDRAKLLPWKELPVPRITPAACLAACSAPGHPQSPPPPPPPPCLRNITGGAWLAAAISTSRLSPHTSAASNPTPAAPCPCRRNDRRLGPPLPPASQQGMPGAGHGGESRRGQAEGHAGPHTARPVHVQHPTSGGAAQGEHGHSFCQYSCTAWFSRVGVLSQHLVQPGAHTARVFKSAGAAATPASAHPTVEGEVSPPRCRPPQTDNFQTRNHVVPSSPPHHHHHRPPPPPTHPFPPPPPPHPHPPPPPPPPPPPHTPPPHHHPPHPQTHTTTTTTHPLPLLQLTIFKRVCRKLGLQRWPYEKPTRVDSSPHRDQPGHFAAPHAQQWQVRPRCQHAGCLLAASTCIGRWGRHRFKPVPRPHTANRKRELAGTWGTSLLPKPASTQPLPLPCLSLS